MLAGGIDLLPPLTSDEQRPIPTSDFAEKLCEPLVLLSARRPLQSLSGSRKTRTKAEP
jgi:hypothetical protein